MISIKDKEGVTATIIQDSISKAGKRIVTFELEYPRFVHAEFMTHRMLSRNAASSRAIPVDKMHAHIQDNPAMPVFWGLNQQGMQAKQEMGVEHKVKAIALWHYAKEQALSFAKQLLDAGSHKQISNRVTEPFQMMKTVCTATEWDNWFWLRDHEDAQPEIRELAICMRQAMQESSPMPIMPGEWHVPYVSRSRNTSGMLDYYTDNNTFLNVREAKMISASCCAQVSYRKSDDTLEKAAAIFERLIHSVPVHASPVEHQATPMQQVDQIFGDQKSWEKGVTHMRWDRLLGSGNFYGWIQFRQLIPNQSK